MTPITLPTPGGDCFAMYAPAPGPTLLMCPPIGDDARMSARLWRNLALDLQRRGLASLRFDLPGTGNSAGEPTDPDILDQWRAAIRACAAWAAHRGDGRISLFGYRFGALLALDALAGHTVDRLVLLDPPASGAAAARQMVARARLDAPADPPEGPGFVEIGGMPLAPSALAAMRSFPTPAPAGSVAAALLVLPRTRTPSPWPDALAATGAAVETIPFEGYDDFVPLDPFDATPPTATVARVAAWLTRGLGPAAAMPADLPRARPLDGGGCRETPLRFGPAGGMFGILCTPDEPRPGAPAILLPTTGVDPCYGMARMWTDLARRLARNGVASLRFDMPGVGESDGDLGPDPLAAIYRADRAADLRHALDALESRGADQVVAVGYCAGAYAAWHAARSDRRIAGIVVGNLLYLDDRPSLPHAALRAKPGGPPGLARLGNALPKGAVRAARRAVPQPIRRAVRDWRSDPADTRRFVGALGARACRVTMVMAQGDPGHLRLRRAFGDQPLPPGIELKVIPGADHLFSDRRHRTTFLDLAVAQILAGAAPLVHSQPLVPETAP